MGQILKILIIALFFSFLGFSAQAANPLDVIINEIAWMGTEVSYNDEWIELRNNSGAELNLDGWILKAADGTPEIKLAGSVPANGFYLLERTDDNTVPGITADKIYTGALNNAGENLKLYDNLGNLIDSADASAGWPAGDNTTKQTMERVLAELSSANWQTSQNTGGTPKAENSAAAASPPAPEPTLTPEPEPEPKPEPALSPEPEPAEPEIGLEPQTALEAASTKPLPITYPSGIVINEILPSPIGADEEEEWIEIFNQNNFEVNLSSWKIADTAGSIKTYAFPEGTVIGPREFLVLPRPTTKITLNNQSDGLKFLRPDESIIDEVKYENAPRGKSYGRLESDWDWTSLLTPGSVNSLPAPTAEPEKKTAENGSPRTELAAISEPVTQNSNVSFLLLAAVFTSFFSGVIILILKKKLKLS